MCFGDVFIPTLRGRGRRTSAGKTNHIRPREQHREMRLPQEMYTSNAESSDVEVNMMKIPGWCVVSLDEILYPNPPGPGTRDEASAEDK